MSRSIKRPAVAFVAGALIVGAVFAGRAAYAMTTSEVVHACFKPSNGSLYLIGDGSARNECQPGDMPISWNAEGPQGAAGSNGRDGVDGQDGADGEDGVDGRDGIDGQDGADGEDGVDGRDGIDGQDGEDFDGSFVSGAFSLEVANDGIVATGPGGSIRLGMTNVTVSGIGSSLTLSPAGANLTGALVRLNSVGSCASAARVGDLVLVGPGGGGMNPYPGGLFPIMPPGSATVCIGG